MLFAEKRTKVVSQEIVRDTWCSTRGFASANSAQWRMILFCTCAVVLFSGCVSYPISKALREEARPLSSEQVVSTPGKYIGTVVIWGGRVLATLNDSNGAAIYVLKLPLGRYERPERHQVFNGRFIVRTSKFIDPELLSGEKLIVVAGEITGVKNEPLQKIRYTYPVLSLKELCICYPRHCYSGYWGWYGPGWGAYGDLDWGGP